VIESLLGGAVAWPVAARAQHPSDIPRIGVLRFGPAALTLTGSKPCGLACASSAMSKARTRYRVLVGGNVDRLGELAAELVRMNVDIIFATSSTEVEAARQATKTIPIVFATHADPVGVGHVANLARPGGNITGLSMLLTELVAKELERVEGSHAAHEASRHALHFHGALLPSYSPRAGDCW
jgi:putative ABC transport system substrate-binding protein